MKELIFLHIGQYGVQVG